MHVYFGNIIKTDERSLNYQKAVDNATHNRTRTKEKLFKNIIARDQRKSTITDQCRSVR